MEILRFEEAPTSAPKRKKSSRGFIALGFVATLFGVSTAFASSTITINDNTEIALGQGVSVFTTCDNFIGVNPVTELDSDLSKFKLTEVTIGTNYEPAVPATPPALYTIAPECLGTNFVVKFYQSPSPTPVDVCTDAYKVTVPSAGTDYICTTSGIFFKVSAISHPILFGESIAPDFFDHISIETTSNVAY